MKLDRALIFWSGGKDSTAILLKMKDLKIPILDAVCVPTTWEWPHIHEVRKRVEEYCDIKIRVEPVERNFWDLLHTDPIMRRSPGEAPTVHRHGYGWPNWFKRWCTGWKQAACAKVSKGFEAAAIGLNADEVGRANKNIRSRANKVYPLITWNMGARECMKYCVERIGKWPSVGYPIPRMSCWCCPLQSMETLYGMFAHRQDLWKILEKHNALIKNEPNYFKRNHTLKNLTKLFQARLDKEQILY